MRFTGTWYLVALAVVTPLVIMAWASQLEDQSFIDVTAAYGLTFGAASFCALASAALIFSSPDGLWLLAARRLGLLLLACMGLGLGLVYGLGWAVLGGLLLFFGDADLAAIFGAPILVLIASGFLSLHYFIADWSRPLPDE
jgi:hypothetical protein